MKTLNTALKLTAIAAVALTLVACGGGGGGGGSVGSVGSAPAANQSDVTIAHNEGWKGQNLSIVTGTVNLTTAAAASFATNVGNLAPLSLMENRGNINGAGLASSYVALGTSTDNVNKLQNGTYTSINGVMVVGFASGTFSGDVGIASGSYSHAAGITMDASSAVAIFDKVVTHSTIDGTVKPESRTITDIAEKTAYVAGSAAIIASKFNTLTNNELVTNMDRSRTADGAFSLSRALAPKNLR